ncbi:DMT family transporter [Paenibacillus guangzhouensis]|uniref:DMT family transporter n=1 Tax=Paenibacillus guangzhouensis TaxID=1473112 RepID=UPI00187B7B72|nr:DMT family transporter [Paenibacillus guangzhouensis]
MENATNSIYFLTALFLVLLSGFLHALWNLFTKSSIKKDVFLWLCQWAGVIVYLPLVVLYIPQSVADIKSYSLLFASMILHGIYVILLAKTYSLGDLSQVYPIMRGTSLLLVPLISVFFLGLHLGIVSWIGISLIVLGIFFISGAKINKISPRPRVEILLASAVGICIASYILVDAISINYWPPFVLNEATNLGNGIALSFSVFRSRTIRNEWKINWKTVLLGGIFAQGGYLLFLYAVTIAPVGQLAPMREIGTVFGTMLGIAILKEKQGKSRIIASIFITTGIIILGFSGR